MENSFSIFNDRYFKQRPFPPGLTGSGVSDCASFPRFQELPAELRLKIWTWHLCHRRFLRVLLEETATETGGPSWHDDVSDDHGEWGPIFSDATERPGIRITFLDASMASVPALPLVCREAYQVYKSFYCIQLSSLVRVPPYPPESVVDPRFETKQIVAHLHPDNDVISLEAFNPPDIIERNLLASFLHVLLQHDSSPDSVCFGVRNLCLDLRQVGDYHDDNISEVGDDYRPRPAATLLPDVLTSVRTSISHLRNLYLRLTTSHPEPRVTSGPLTGSGALPWYNASMPILPSPSWQGFSSQIAPVEGVDTRLQDLEGAADLRQVWIGRQIAPSIKVWEDLERGWGVERENDDDGKAGTGDGLHVRALVALTPQRSRSIAEFLQIEKADWLSLMDPTSDFGTLVLDLFEGAQRTLLAGSVSPTTESMSPEDWFLRRRHQTAVGYWLVDPDVLKDAKTKGATEKNIVDLSKQGQTALELWVFHGTS